MDDQRSGGATAKGLGTRLGVRAYASPPSASADLRRIAVFRDVPQAELDGIYPSLVARIVRGGATLNLGNDLSRKVCFVWSGTYRLVLAAAPKRPVVIKQLRSGDTFGYLVELASATWGSASLRLECLDGGMLLQMEAEHFAAARRTIPALADATLDLISSVAADQGTRIFELVALNARERVQAELLRLARAGERIDGRCVLRPSPTHQGLADQVGVTREVVTRTLHAMAEEGLIRVERGAIEILDVGRLGELDHAATGRRMLDPTDYFSTLFLASACLG